MYLPLLLPAPSADFHCLHPGEPFYALQPKKLRHTSKILQSNEVRDLDRCDKSQHKHVRQTLRISTLLLKAVKSARNACTYKFQKHPLICFLPWLLQGCNFGNLKSVQMIIQGLKDPKYPGYYKQEAMRPNSLFPIPNLKWIVNTLPDDVLAYTCPTKDRKQCAPFPYYYKGVQYKGCTRYNYAGKPWCATAKSNDGQMTTWSDCTTEPNRCCRGECGEQYNILLTLLTQQLDIDFAAKDCNWGAWDNWDACTSPCGQGGNRIRTRRRRNEEEFGGKPCLGEDKEREYCNGRCNDPRQ